MMLAAMVMGLGVGIVLGPRLLAALRGPLARLRPTVERTGHALYLPLMAAGLWLLWRLERGPLFWILAVVLGLVWMAGGSVLSLAQGLPESQGRSGRARAATLLCLLVFGPELLLAGAAWSGPVIDAHLLTELAGPRATPIVLRWSTQSGSDAGNCSRALSSLGEGAMPYLAETARHSPDARIRGAAIMRLRVSSPLTVPALVAALADPDSTISGIAVRRLIGGYHATVFALAWAATDGRGDMAAWLERGTWGLTDREMREVRRDLGDRWETARLESLRILCLRAAAPAYAPVYRTALEDPSPAVREMAAAALELATDRESRQALERAANEDPDPDVRRSAAEALAKMLPGMPAWASTVRVPGVVLHAEPVWAP